MKKLFLLMLVTAFASYADGQTNMSNNFTPIPLPVPLAHNQTEGKKLALRLVEPSNGDTFPTGKQVMFSWYASSKNPEVVAYKIKIVEIKGDESPEQAFRGNKPFFERDSIERPRMGNKPHFEKDSLKELSFRGNKPFFERDSIERPRIGNKPHFEKDSLKELSFRGNKPFFERDSIERPRMGNKPHFEKDSLKELSFKGNKPFFERDSAGQRSMGNKPHFEKDSLTELSFYYYPNTAPPFIAGKKYAWNVQALNRDGKPIGGNNGTSETKTFFISNPQKKDN